MIDFLPPYIEWLFWSIWLPTALLLIIYHKILLKYPITYIKVIIGSLIVGVIWDYVAVWGRIWEYPDNCCIGAEIYRLPVDEFIWITSAAVLISMVTLIIRSYTFTAKRPRR
jgi:lycopene cyclase domain-containing protein